MNNIHFFLNKENIDTLWDVICDIQIFKKLPKNYKENVFDVFHNNLNGFYEVESKKTVNLIDLNKKCVLLILNYIQTKYSFKLSQKIKIHDDYDDKSITYAEIQNDKRTQFEKDLHLKKQDFENLIKLKVPPIPNFSDKYEENPIVESIQEIILKRNYDISQINNTFQENSSKKWLNSLDTSIKSEKINDDKKNVSWGNNEEIEFEDNDNDNNIFLKLKQIPYKNNEDRFIFIENEIKKMNLKINELINILKK